LQTCNEKRGQRGFRLSSQYLFFVFLRWIMHTEKEMAIWSRNKRGKCEVCSQCIAPTDLPA
jgi:hypothetical protein